MLVQLESAKAANRQLAAAQAHIADLSQKLDASRQAVRDREQHWQQERAALGNGTAIAELQATIASQKQELHIKQMQLAGALTSKQKLQAAEEEASKAHKEAKVQTAMECVLLECCLLTALSYAIGPICA